MRVKVIGKTDTVIMLNLMGIVLQGRVEGIFDVQGPQNAELMVLKKAGLIDIIRLDVPDVPVVPVVPKAETPEPVVEPVVEPRVKKGKAGRPKGSKNKSKNKPKNKPKTPKTATPKTSAQKAADAEAETQKVGAEVIISNGKETKRVKMRSTFASEIPESEATRKSIEAMEKLEEESKADLEGRQIDIDPTPIDESKLDPSEQMGRAAIISDMGETKQVGMVNSSVPGSDEVRNRDPFIDNNQLPKPVAEKAKVVSKEPSLIIDVPGINNEPLELDFLDNDPPDDGDSFIEI